MPDLTPSEQEFFKTGTLPPDLAAQAEQQEVPLDPVALAGLGKESAPEVAKAAPSVAEQVLPAETPTEDLAEMLRRSLAEAQEKIARLEQLTVQQQQAVRPPEKAAPDPTTDPLGAMMHQLDTVNKTVAELQTQLTQQQIQQTQTATFHQFQQQIATLRDQFAKSAPDFNDAYAHLRSARLADLATFGVVGQNAQQVLFQEETALAENAIRQGKNPAAVVYEMAKRHGFKVQTITPEKKIDTIKQGQAAVKNLPKSVTPEDVSIDSLRTLSEQDLNKIILDKKQWNKLLGQDSYPI